MPSRAYLRSVYLSRFSVLSFSDFRCFRSAACAFATTAVCL
jgi:hypothetical protein